MYYDNDRSLLFTSCNFSFRSVNKSVLACLLLWLSIVLTFLNVLSAYSHSKTCSLFLTNRLCYNYKYIKFCGMETYTGN